MTALTSRTRTSTPTVGERTELARYTLRDGHERLLFGQRIDGVVRISDHPANGIGRRYLVERGLEQDGYGAVRALVADYVAQATKHGAIPAADNALDRYLDRTAS